MSGTGEAHREMSPKSNEGYAIQNVLIVDDDSNFRQGILRMFYVLGKAVTFRGFEAAAGAQAIEILKQHRIDCVLLDYKMTGGSGLEWLARIVESNEDIPVIMVTGEGDEQTAVAALKNGATDYLVKGSITPEAMRKTLMNAIEKTRMRAVLERQRIELLEAEKQKVMIQSLGAACHHLGQPATGLQCTLTLLNRLPLAPEVKSLVQESCDFADQMNAILHDLQKVCAFIPEVYRERTPGESERRDECILQIAHSKPT